jgi:hypothetical protein
VTPEQESDGDVCPQHAPVLPVNAIVNHRESSRGQSQLACTISNRSALDSLVMSRSMLATDQLGKMTHNVPACYGLNGKWDGWSVVIETQSAMSPYTPHRTRIV